MSDIYLTATTESNPQVIDYWTRYWYSGAWQYWQLQCVAWISQEKARGDENPKTTIKYKWRVAQSGYYPFWNDSHVYTLEFGGRSDSVSFSLPQNKADGIRDMCSARTLGTFEHDDNGELSGTFYFSGATCKGYYWDGSYADWSLVSESLSGSVPSLDPPAPPEPDPPTPVDPEPDPPTPLEFDNDPRFYIYADNGNGNELVYAAGIDGYEVLNPKLSIEVNKAGSLTFDIPVGSRMYNDINKLKTTIEARQGNEILFRGRLLNTKRNVMNTITCYCEGFLSWLVDISFQPYPWNGQARDLLKRLIERYNSRASSNRLVTYKYSDISAKITLEQKNFSTCWNEIKNVLLNNIGGYIVPYLTAQETGIQWLSTYGATTSQVIQFGQNLLDFEEYVDASSVFTAVRAYGKEVDGNRIGLSGNNGFVSDEEAEAVYGRIERVVYFDEINDEDALRTAATDYLRTGVQSAMTISIKAVDTHLLNINVERIRLGDSVRVVSVPHSVDAHFLCTKIVYDFAHPQNTVYTFGSTQRTISELTDASYNRYVITEEA